MNSSASTIQHCPQSTLDENEISTEMAWESRKMRKLYPGLRLDYRCDDAENVLELRRPFRINAQLKTLGFQKYRPLPQ